MALRGMLVDNADVNNKSEDDLINEKKEYDVQSE